jgi:hypothetical protein
MLGTQGNRWPTSGREREYCDILRTAEIRDLSNPQAAVFPIRDLTNGVAELRGGSLVFVYDAQM